MSAMEADGAADLDGTKVLILKLLALADRMEQRDAQVMRQMAEHVAALERALRDVRDGGHRLAADTLAAVRADARDVLQAGLADATARHRDALQQAASELRRASDDARGSADALHRQRAPWLWAAPIALATGSVLAFGAAAWTVADSRAQVARHRVEADLLRAYNAADVTLCGGRLCANVDDTQPRHGERRQYRVVRPR